MAGFDTAANIINEAAKEVGLYSTPLADPFASTDQAVLQLAQLVNGLGQDLWRDYDWTHLQKEYTFNTASMTAAYALPSDFGRVVNGTHWNRTQTRWLLGPVNPRDWQTLKGQGVVLVDQAFRTWNDEFHLYPTPSAIEAIYYEYISRYWVKETGQSAPNTETLDAYTDTIHFDRRLMVLGAKFYWLRAKGQPSDSALQDFEGALQRALGADGAAPTLNQGRRNGLKLIGYDNLPETGYGL